MSDFVDADPEPDDLPEERALRALILAQGLRGTAIPVLLFSTATLDAADAKGSAAPEVTATAAELGVDLAHLALFSDDAYLLQTALGERLLPGAP